MSTPLPPACLPACLLCGVPQTACTTVKHLALGVAMLGCEDALVHLLNFVWPNIFETSPHVINAVFEAIEVSQALPARAAIL